MTSSIVLGLAVALPVILIALLRTDAAIIFLSLCVGYVLSRFVGDTAVLTAATFDTNVSEGYVQIAILLLPAILSAFLLRKSVSSSKYLFNVFPAIAVGLTAVLLVMPFLPDAAASQVEASEFWPTLHSSQDLVVAAGSLVSLGVLWMGHKSPKKHKSKKHE